MSNEHDKDRSDWIELDDTLADGPCPAGVPEEARPWLAEQRTMHGLLRALHTADASARESRIAAILGRIDEHTVTSQRRHWLAVAAAAMVMASVGVWFALPRSLPTAEAAMARAADQLALDVDRRFHVRLSRAGKNRPEKVNSEFDLITRPGKRFVVEGRFAFAGLRLAAGRIGSDGKTLWVDPKDGRNRRSGRLANREQLLEGLGEILDLGYVDWGSLIGKLPGEFNLRVVRRSVDPNGNEQLHITANRRDQQGAIKLRSAEVSIDNLTGMVTRLDAEIRVVGGGPKRVIIEYLGRIEPGAVDYSRPW